MTHVIIRKRWDLSDECTASFHYSFMNEFQTPYRRHQLKITRSDDDELGRLIFLHGTLQHEEGIFTTELPDQYTKNIIEQLSEPEIRVFSDPVIDYLRN